MSNGYEEMNKSKGAVNPANRVSLTKRGGDIQEKGGIRGEEIKRDKENRLTFSTFTDSYTVSTQRSDTLRAQTPKDR